MSKVKQQYVCQSCGSIAPKWLGQCLDCQAWNSFVAEISAAPAKASRYAGFAGVQDASVTPIADVELTETPRMQTGQAELDRVLGGGLVAGSVVLIGGDPGIGKSTLLIQTLATLSENCRCLYITGEESLQQITLRAKRLGLLDHALYLLAETNIEKILAKLNQEKPDVVVIDSIQTIYTDLVQSAPGGVSQVRESAAQLVRFAKQTGVALFLVGHVTKEGSLAGPRVLEHMVDAVLYFEGETDSRYRMVRAIKNRFGAVNELGIFAMTDSGLKGVSNPSAIFLSRYDKPVPGSVIMVNWEGSRPLLVEVQALVADTPLANPRRVTVGLDQNRLAMLLAVLVRHGDIACYGQDVFVNVVGGVRIFETAVDLALIFAVISSFKNRLIPHDLIVFGEIGLSGEIRPVQSGQERLKEAAKHGFKRAIVPKLNAPKNVIDGLEVIGVNTLQEALGYL